MDCSCSRYCIEYRFFYWNNNYIYKYCCFIFWLPLKQKPGIGTILNALIIGLMIDVCIKFVPTPENYIYQIFLSYYSCTYSGIGGGIYLVANLGAGPRDGLMIGLTKKNKFTNCYC